MTETTTRNHVTQLATVIVPVSDQARALEFYTEILGFEKRIDVPLGSEDRWIEVAPAGGTTTIAIFPPPNGQPIGVETGIALATDDVDADHAYLQSRGVEVDEEVMRMGDPVPPMFKLADPDGNKLSIVETGR
jgi:predicted enzyme related to lactoylglutathione lyase